MDPLDNLKKEMDAWIKDIQDKLIDVEIIKKHDDNIDHNYELIQNLASQVRTLREELTALRLAQMLMLKEMQKKSK